MVPTLFESLRMTSPTSRGDHTTRSQGRNVRGLSRLAWHGKQPAWSDRSLPRVSASPSHIAILCKHDL